jgi:hypothetical protein
MTPGTTRERPTTTNSSRFKSLLVPLYAFGIALLLTLGAGSLAPETDNEVARLTKELEETQSDLSAAQATVTTLEEQLEDQEKADPPNAGEEKPSQGVEVQKPTADPPPAQPGALTVRIETDPFVPPALSPDAQRGVVVDWWKGTTKLGEEAGIPSDGRIQISAVTPRPTVVCVDPGPGWQVAEAKTANVRDDNRPETANRKCINLTAEPEITFTLEVAPR